MGLSADIEVGFVTRKLPSIYEIPHFLTLLLCCLQCNVPALAAPATLDTSALSLDAFITSLLSNHVTADLIQLPALPLNTSTSLNTTTSSNAMIPYRVPNTPTLLNFVLYNTPIEKANMGRTILRTQQALRAQIAGTATPGPPPPTGQRTLQERSSLDWLCFLGVIAFPPAKPLRFAIEYHLTYGVVVNVLQGLWEFLYRGNRFVKAAFEVLDDFWGLVGLGRVSRERPGQEGMDGDGRVVGGMLWGGDVLFQDFKRWDLEP